MPASDETGGYIELGDEIEAFHDTGKLHELIREHLERRKAFPD